MILHLQMLKLLFLIQIACSAIVLANMRLREIEKLIKRFGSEIDVNYLFYDKLLEQKNNPLLCNAESGPYCSIINKRSLLDHVEEDSADLKLRKAGVILDWENLRRQERTTTEGFFVINNNHRDMVLGTRRPQQVEAPTEGIALIDFEALSLEDEEAFVKDALIYEPFKDVSVSIGNSNDGKGGAYGIRVSFEGVYLPGHSTVFNKKLISESEKYQKEHKETAPDQLKPTEVYVFTKKEDGKMHFSQPVTIKQIHVRKHNFVAYDEERKEQGTYTDRVYHHLKGLYQGNEVVTFERVSFHNKANDWIKLIPNKENPNAIIDTLIVEHNTDIDNIFIKTFVKHSSKSLTINHLQQLIMHLGEKTSQYSNLKDEALLTKILKDDVRAYLGKEGFDDVLIERILQKLKLKRRGGDQYEIQIEDPYTFVSEYSDKIIQGLNFENNLKNDPAKVEAITEEIKNVFRDSLKDQGLLNENNNFEIKKLLEQIDPQVQAQAQAQAQANTQLQAKNQAQGQVSSQTSNQALSQPQSLQPPQPQSQTQIHLKSSDQSQSSIQQQSLAQTTSIETADQTLVKLQTQPHTEPQPKATTQTKTLEQETNPSVPTQPEQQDPQPHENTQNNIEPPVQTQSQTQTQAEIRVDPQSSTQPSSQSQSQDRPQASDFRQMAEL